jgi:uncharacterized protein YcnI
VRRALPAGVLLALLLPSRALAHVTVLPAFVEDGQRTTLVFSAPNERPPHAMTRLTVSVPAGIELTEATPPPGWTVAVAARTATWSGGRTGPHETGQFRIGAKTELEPTAVTLVAVQRYDDGGTVRWTIPFTILPASHAPKQHLWPAFLAGVIGLAVIAAGLALLRLRRRPMSRAR